MKLLLAFLLSSVFAQDVKKRMTLPSKGTNKTFPNVGYLGRGYDLLYGNPSTTSLSGTDPGFRLNVFKFEYGTKLTPDLRFKVPDGVEVHNAESCSISFDSVEVTKSSEYSETLGKHVDASIGYGPVKFTASADFKTVDRATQNFNNVFTMTEAVCTKYEAAIEPFIPPKFTDNFKAAIQKFLPTSDDKVALKRFVDAFGTHVTMKLIMGARYGEMTQVDSNSWEKYKENTVGWKLALSASTTVSFGASLSSETTKKNVNNFKKIATSQKVISLGSKPPAKGQGAEGWAQRVFENPMPIKYKLMRIDKLLSYSYLPTDFLPAGVLEKKQSALSKYLTDYCSYLEKTGDVKTCDPEDPSTPATCRLCETCASSGNFSMESGLHLASPGSWDYYGKGCQGGLKRDFMPWRLCCSPPKPECQLCSVCGGEYPHETGRREGVQYFTDYFRAKQDECTGAYANTISVFRLCCRRKSSMCRLCEKECGRGMQAIGNRHHMVGKGDVIVTNPFATFAPGHCDRDSPLSDDPKIYRIGKWLEYNVKWCCPV